LIRSLNAVSNAWIDGGALRTYRLRPQHRLAQELGGGDATSP